VSGGLRAQLTQHATRRTQPYRNVAPKPMGGAGNMPRPTMPELGPRGPALNAMLAGRPMAGFNPKDVERRLAKAARRRSR
jgi:hypothetical protein